MKIAKWLIAVAALLVFVGCEKSDEQKLEDAANDAQKSMSKAIDGLKK